MLTTRLKAMFSSKGNGPWWMAVHLLEKGRQEGIKDVKVYNVVLKASHPPASLLPQGFSRGRLCRVGQTGNETAMLSVTVDAFPRFGSSRVLSSVVLLEAERVPSAQTPAQEHRIERFVGSDDPGRRRIVQS